MADEWKATMIYVIQYLRAFASFLVLLAHVRIKSGQNGGDFLSIFRVGYYGVDIFFVISGFVMCLIYSTSGSGVKEVAPFWIRRVNRILPLYWILTLMALAVFLIAPSKVNSSGGTTSIWRSFLLLPGGGKFLIENGWTLSYEFLFYGFFTLSFMAAKKWVGAIFVAFFMAATVLLGSTGVLANDFLTDPIILEFAMGMLAYYIYKNVRGPLAPLLGAAALVASVAVFVALNLSQNLFEGRFWRAGTASFLLVVGLLALEQYARARPLKFLLSLGASSYSLYLTHPFVFAAGGILFKKLSIGSMGSTAAAAYWSSLVVVALFAGHAVHLFVELPLIRFAQKLTRTGAKNKAMPA